MGKLLTELNRTGHDCFGHRAVPWMCNLKYSEDGDPTIIPYVYKEAATYPPTSRDSKNKDGIIATLNKNIAIEKKKKELQEAKALNAPKEPTSPARRPKARPEPRPLPPMPAPREKVRQVAPTGIPDSINLNDDGPVPDLAPASPSSTPYGPQAPGVPGRPSLPAFATPEARALLSPVTTEAPSPGPESPSHATPPTTTPSTMTPTEIKPTVDPAEQQRKANGLSVKRIPGTSGYTVIRKTENGLDTQEVSRRELEEMGADNAGKMFDNGSTCERDTYYGRIGAKHYMGWDSRGKLVEYIECNGQRHYMDQFGNFTNETPLSSRDGLDPFTPEERRNGMAIIGFYKTADGQGYVDCRNGKVYNKAQYASLLQSGKCPTMDKWHPGFKAQKLVDQSVLDTGVQTGFVLRPKLVDGVQKYYVYHVMDQGQKPVMEINLGDKIWYGLGGREQTYDFGGMDPTQVAENANMYSGASQQNGEIAIMSNSPVWERILEINPKAASMLPQSITMEPTANGTICTAVFNPTGKPGEEKQVRIPEHLGAVMPFTSLDYGYRDATDDECKLHGLPAGTQMHMTTDVYGRTHVEAVSPTGEHYGGLNPEETNEGGSMLTDRFYRDPYYDNSENESSSSDKWNQVLKYVMLGLPIGLALGLVGWGITGGKGSLGSALLGGAGLGATLGGLGAYTGYLGGNRESEDDYSYGSAMNAGY